MKKPIKTKKKVVKKTTSKKKDKKVLRSAVPLQTFDKLAFRIPNMPKAVGGVDGSWGKRIFMFTPVTGLVRVEWMQSRYSQVIPTNWSFVEMQSFLSPYMPLAYQLADAQNLMAKEVVEKDYEWVIYIEHDNLLPPDGLLRFNQYINEQKVPVVSGLYFLKSDITEPLLYRGRGTSHFKDWKFGDKVWVDGIPFGFRLEHASLIKAAWEESEEYQVGSVTTRKVFEQPNSMWHDEETGNYVAKAGTTDLQWCSRIIDDKLFEKAGWPEFQKRKNPFLVDTNIFVKHIDMSGQIWPKTIPAHFISDDPKYKGKEIT